MRMINVAASGVLAAGLFCFSPTGSSWAGQACPGRLGAEASDFNGDGHADAAVGDPFASVGGRDGAGTLTVMYGDDDGRAGEGGRIRFDQSSPGVPGTAEAGDRFGFALEAVNLNGDGCTDLVVGVPGEDVGGSADAGAVIVLFGAPAGLGAGHSIWIDQESPGVPGGGERSDQFGYRLGAVPARGADAATVAVGIPYEDVGSVRDAGAVTVLWFTGSDRPAARWFDQDTPGVPGEPETADLFGSGVEPVRVSGSSGRWDLVVGIPYEDLGSERNAGAMTRIEDIAEARSSFPSRWWTQDSAGVIGTTEAGDLFGTDPERVATPEGDYLAVGAPGEDLYGVENGGMAQVFRGSADDRLRPYRVFHQNLPGAAGAAEAGDHFAAELHGVTRPTSGGHARLVVGLPYEDIGRTVDAGAVQTFSLDAETVEDRWISQQAEDIPGGPDRGDRLGAALGSAGDADEQVLLIAVPAEDGVGMVHVLPFADGTGRLWYPGSGGLPGNTERFGFSLAGHSCCTEPGQRTTSPDGRERSWDCRHSSGASFANSSCRSNTRTLAWRHWQPRTPSANRLPRQPRRRLPSASRPRCSH